MCVDLLLLKFNSDEKQFTRLFIPMVVSPCGGGWALRAGIGMTINLTGHSMSVTVLFSHA